MGRIWTETARHPPKRVPQLLLFPAPPLFRGLCDRTEQRRVSPALQRGVCVDA